MSLTDFIPEAIAVEAGGKVFAIEPLRVRQIPPFVRAVGPALAALSTGNLLAALADHGEAVIAAVAVATGETEAWLGELPADEFLALAAEIVEVNAVFFGQRVMPQFNQTAARLTKALTDAPPGPTASPSSPLAASASTPPST